MTNHEKYTIETMGVITGPEQLKELQADIRRLPNFNGKGICASTLAHRDFWAVLKDRRTKEIVAYFGTRDSFNHWGQEEAVSDGAAEMMMVHVSCWVCGDNPVRNKRCELKEVRKAGDVSVWECQACHEKPAAERPVLQ